MKDARWASRNTGTRRVQHARAWGLEPSWTWTWTSARFALGPVGMAGKVLARATLARRLAAARRAGQRVVFTNGCFDLLHPGHVRYLAAARALGDLLVVGVNSDASVRRLEKGAGRPLVGERDRAEVVAALAAVDYACLFAEDTPLELIRALRPDILVKGGDWPADKIVGADLVRGRGGTVHSLPFAPGYSTTDLVRRIRGGRVPSRKSQIPRK